MAANTVGSVTFDLVEQADYIASQTERTESHSRRGIDGEEVLSTGARSAPATWRGCYKWDTSSANAYAHLAAVAAIDGTIVTVYDPYEVSTANVLVTVTQPLGTPRYVVKDGNARYETVVNLTLQKMD